MFKKIVAVSMALIIMIMPMTASAVTWGTVVQQLNETGRYSGEGIDASFADGEVVVNGSEGATIEGEATDWSEGRLLIDIYADLIDGANRYVFNNITASHGFNIDSTSVTLGKGSTVNGKVDISIFEDDHFAFVNNGTVNGDINGWSNSNSSVTLTNNGAVDGNVFLNMGESEGEATTNSTGLLTNNGTISGDMNGMAFSGGTVTATNGQDGIINGGLFGGSSHGDGNATLINNGIVGDFYSWAEDAGKTNIINNGTVEGSMFAHSEQSGTLAIENNGEVGGELYAEARDTSSMTVTNNGEVFDDLQLATRDESTSSTANNGHVGGMMFIEASQNATASGINTGTVDGALLSAVQDWDEEQEVNIPNVGTGSASVVNEGEVGRVITAMVDGQGTASSVNNGTVDMNMNSFARNGGTATTTNNGTVKGSSFTQALEGSNANTVNNGEIGKTIGGYAAAGAQTNIVNNGKVSEAYVDIGIGSSGETGSIAITGSGSIGKLTVEVMASEGVDTSTPEARQKIATDIAGGLTVYAGQLGLTEGNATIDVIIYDENGNEIDTFEAEVPLAPVPKEQEDNGPSEEQIRHEMEEKRQAESIGGVFASPYWCWQMSLGYRSLNFRVHDAAGEKILIRERLGWIDGGPMKNLNLRVRTDETAGVNIRFDEEVLDILERTEIATITLLTYEDRTPFMQYQVADLRAAFTRFGLERTDLLVIGGMDDEVMKIGADGKLVPVE